MNSGPYTGYEENSLMWSIDNAPILAQTKIKIMQQVVARCSMVSMCPWNPDTISVGFQHSSDTALAVIL